MKQKNTYESCELEIKNLAAEDVILTSGWGNLGGDDEPNSDANGWT